MDNVNLEGATRLIRLHGPSRVVISEEYEAVGSKRARNQFGIEPDIIFIRRDGWSLGAPMRWADVAESSWQGFWIGVLIKPATEPMPYVDYAASVLR